MSEFESELEHILMNDAERALWVLTEYCANVEGREYVDFLLSLREIVLQLGYEDSLVVDALTLEQLPDEEAFDQDQDTFVKEISFAPLRLLAQSHPAGNRFTDKWLDMVIDVALSSAPEGHQVFSGNVLTDYADPLVQGEPCCHERSCHIREVSNLVMQAANRKDVSLIHSGYDKTDQGVTDLAVRTLYAGYRNGLLPEVYVTLCVELLYRQDNGVALEG